MTHLLNVVVALPAHSALTGPLSYLSERALAPGTLVRAPLGKREVLGVVWDSATSSGDVPQLQIKGIAGTLSDLAPLNARWRALVSFTASYYQRSLGEVALAALPPQLRELNGVQLARRLKRPVADTSSPHNTIDLIAASAQQTRAIADFDAERKAKRRPALLFGATGSGKTEVYLRLAASALAQDAQAQVLVMVPEINLTPQLQSRFIARFAHLGAERVVAMHSGLTPAQRLKSWIAAHVGDARLILGTRMAVLASMPHLKLIVVDEEHDPSYKQQEGARYSARDLAVYRASIEPGCRVLLGSATPSLESWHSAVTGKYQLLEMADRIGTSLPLAPGESRGEGSPPVSPTPGQLPKILRIDMSQQPKACIIAPPLVKAIEERIARGEQSLIFLNRRGYAPVDRKSVV